MLRLERYFRHVNKQVIIIGGGAAGYFCALQLAELAPDTKITILEKGTQTLAKVKISGGGRCNVTHACFDPKELVQFYPRGHKELLGPFNRFQPADTIQWFADRGVELKVEDDGRMFPTTDSSQTIIDCFEKRAEERGVKVWTQAGVSAFRKTETGWEVEINKSNTIQADAVVLATGSSALMWDYVAQLGHTIISPVASLFTFTIKDKRIDGLAGVSSPLAEVSIEDSDFESSGPLLITHWGLSGPGILKLSAWAARFLAEKNYRFSIRVNWEGNRSLDEVLEVLKSWRNHSAKKLVVQHSPFSFPNRLWSSLASKHVGAEKKWADLSNAHLSAIAEEVAHGRYEVNGKSTFKDEFVTAGGISLKEVDFKTMQSKKSEGLFFAGEVLDIDAVTGGFNFQAAWTTATIAAQAISESLSAK